LSGGVKPCHDPGLRTRQETAADKSFTAEQRAFLTLVAEEIGANRKP
jgi:hypothetical protein